MPRPLQPVDIPLVRSSLQANGIVCFLELLPNWLSVSALLNEVFADDPEMNSLASVEICGARRKKEKSALSYSCRW